MATNEILRFAETDTGTNLLTQAEYLADSQRPIGNQPGVARSKLVNKALRQASLIAAGVAEFLADNQANNITDGLTPQDIADYMAAVVRSLGIPTAVAGGTADAITADFTPNVSLINGTTVIVRAGSANATTTPTFAPDGLTAKTIVKGNNLALVAGDIAGAGHWLELNFDTVLDKWVLQNPALGIAPGVEPGSIIYVARNTAPTGYLKANGALVSRTTYAALFAAIGTTFGAGDGSTTFALPDLRGEFVRGWDDGRGIDSGRVFGSQQGASTLANRMVYTNLSGNQGEISPNFTNGENGVLIGSAPFQTSTTFSTSQNASRYDLRPRSIAMLACIKF